MNNTDLVIVVSVVGIISSLSGIVLGWVAKARNTKQDTAAEARNAGRLESTLEYIRHGVDEVRLEQRAQGKQFDELSERVTRVEEGLKSTNDQLARVRMGGVV